LTDTVTWAGEPACVNPILVSSDSHPLPSLTLAEAWKISGVVELANTCMACGVSAPGAALRKSRPAGSGSGTTGAEEATMCRTT
jgi:hypothetical protein